MSEIFNTTPSKNEIGVAQLITIDPTKGDIKLDKLITIDPLINYAQTAIEAQIIKKNIPKYDPQSVPHETLILDNNTQDVPRGTLTKTENIQYFKPFQECWGGLEIVADRYFDTTDGTEKQLDGLQFPICVYQISGLNKVIKTPMMVGGVIEYLGQDFTEITLSVIIPSIGNDRANEQIDLLLRHLRAIKTLKVKSEVLKGHLDTFGSEVFKIAVESYPFNIDSEKVFRIEIKGTLDKEYTVNLNL